MKTKKLWEHQLLALKLAKDKDNFALFFETGTGKTRTCIELITQKQQKAKRSLRTLVLTPSVVTFNWKKEFSLFSDIPNEHVMVLCGTGLERLKQLERTPNYFVVICNYETLLMEQVFGALKTWGPEIIVADESHRIKSHKAQRTKKAIALSNHAKHSFILSGTPILQNQADLFAQYLFLDGGKSLGRNFFNFRAHYFADANALLRKKSKLVSWPKWVPKKNKEKELQEKILSQALAVKKSECLDLPPFIRQTYEVDMSPQQARAYQEMKNDYITFVNSTAYTAQLAITKALRLSQIASGFLMGENGKTHIFENTPKEKALLELLEDLTPNHKIIVWACWKANQQQIKKLLETHKIEFRELLGDSTATQRDKAIQDFRENEKVRVLIGSPAAGGIGINLIEASHSIYYSRSFSLEHDVQSEARNFRGGTELLHSKITRIDLVSRGTIDAEISKALAAKLEIGESILGGKIAI